MKKTYAICRTEKLKAWSTLSKSVGHNLRTSNDERSHLAQGHPEPIRVLAGDPGWEKPWRKKVKGMWLPGLKQGDRHTLAREFFLGASPEFFKDKSAGDIERWAEANVKWLQERFGAERVKLAVLHLDEQAPHVAAYVVPLKRDANRAGVVNKRANGWTLSDAEIGLGGSKECYEKLQDEYAAAMKSFGLERGERNSKAEHQTISDWLKQMRITMPEKIQFYRPEPPQLFEHINITAYGERVAKQAAKAIYDQMKPAYTQAKRVPKLERQVKEQSGVIDELKRARKALKMALEAILGKGVDLDSIRGQETLKDAVIEHIESKKIDSDLPPTPEHTHVRAHVRDTLPSAGRRRGAAPR